MFQFAVSHYQFTYFIGLDGPDVIRPSHTYSHPPYIGICTNKPTHPPHPLTPTSTPPTHTHIHPTHSHPHIPPQLLHHDCAVMPPNPLRVSHSLTSPLNFPQRNQIPNHFPCMPTRRFPLFPLSHNIPTNLSANSTAPTSWSKRLNHCHSLLKQKHHKTPPTPQLAANMALTQQRVGTSSFLGINQKMYACAYMYNRATFPW